MIKVDNPKSSHLEGGGVGGLCKFSIKKIEKKEKVICMKKSAR